MGFSFKHSNTFLQQENGHIKGVNGHIKGVNGHIKGVNGHIKGVKQRSRDETPLIKASSDNIPLKTSSPCLVYFHLFLRKVN